jgi:hypothetical protein
MIEIRAYSPPDVGTEEQIIWRLGWSVVRQWSGLPDGARVRILEQATFIADKHGTVQLNEQIKAFISKHAVTSDAQRS